MTEKAGQMIQQVQAGLDDVKKDLITIYNKGIVDGVKYLKDIIEPEPNLDHKSICELCNQFIKQNTPKEESEIPANDFLSALAAMAEAKKNEDKAIDTFFEIEIASENAEEYKSIFEDDIDESKKDEILSKIDVLDQLINKACDTITYNKENNKPLLDNIANLTISEDNYRFIIIGCVNSDESYKFNIKFSIWYEDDESEDNNEATDEPEANEEDVTPSVL